MGENEGERGKGWSSAAPEVERKMVDKSEKWLSNSGGVPLGVWMRERERERFGVSMANFRTRSP